MREVEFTTYIAAVPALGLQTGADMAELFRGGLQSVELAQREGARAIGFGNVGTVR